MLDQHSSADNLRKTIEALRALDFFAGWAQASTTELLTQVQAFHGPDWGALLAETRSQAALDQLILQADRERVWSGDLEGVSPGAGAYRDTLLAWAAIGRGRFQPSNVQERWGSPAGPVVVSWSIDGREFRFEHRDGHDDFLHHLALLRLVNQGLADRRTAFVACDDFPGDCRFVVLLAHDERQWLKQRRGWSFCAGA